MVSILTLFTAIEWLTEMCELLSEDLVQKWKA